MACSNSTVLFLRSWLHLIFFYPKHVTLTSHKYYGGRL
jgi:hypothetical protein